MNASHFYCSYTAPHTGSQDVSHCLLPGSGLCTPANSNAEGGQALASDCQNGQAYAAKIGKAKVLVASSNSIVHHTAPVGWLGAVPPHQSPHPASSATDEESPITVL